MTATTGSARRTGAQTRAEILLVALELFTEKGFEATSRNLDAPICVNPAATSTRRLGRPVGALGLSGSGAGQDLPGRSFGVGRVVLAVAAAMLTASAVHLRNRDRRGQPESRRASRTSWRGFCWHQAA